ncbi:DUF502 domain-containing protein [Planctomycetales bacterium ZRK34]|nr:DUF502 domain-containing protein [Planctomycetales bacterium ZRK34]
MTGQNPKKHRSGFQQFFLRGLGILLPTILTIWILVAVYQFVQGNIAGPINGWVKQGIVQFANVPVSNDEVQEFEQNLSAEQRAAWRNAGLKPDWLTREIRRSKVQHWWNTVSIGNWAVMDLVGLLIAAVLIYFVGRVLGSFIGRRIYGRLELLLQRVPVFKQVYPHVKQVTDFLVGGSSDKMRFSKVVAVEYPRKGIWSVGLVTGDTMRNIQERAGVECMTIFVPSSPTPFTGYVITVPIADTIELDIPIDAALKFTISGGVIVPPSQLIHGHDQSDRPEQLEARPDPEPQRQST